MPLRIGIIVGEVSGDILGANLIEALKKKYPDLEVEGVVGPRLLESGATQIYPMSILSVMGIIEPLKHLLRLFKTRNWLVRYFTEEPPDLFIGVDAPDFNLGLEKKLRAAGIPVVHYVSPSVWAWRKGRIKTIKLACDLMLTLFPFETKIYQENNIPVKFVGHPTADKVNSVVDIDAVRKKLELPTNKTIIGLMPGSRSGELKRHVPLYLNVAKKCLEKNPNLYFVVPLTSQVQASYFDAIKQEVAPDLPITLIVNNSFDTMAASDVMLVTSGTATLEVMLHKKPMVVAYKTSFITYWLARMLVYAKYIALPNLLADKLVVKEFIQGDATVANLSEELLYLVKDKNKRDEQTEIFVALHKTLKQDSANTAVNAIVELLGR